MATDGKQTLHREPEPAQAKDKRRSSGIEVGPATLAGKAKEIATTAGNLGRFSFQVLGAMGTLVRHYPTEALRQAGTIIGSSAFIIWLMYLLGGAWCGNQIAYFADQIGAPGLTGLGGVACIRAVSVLAFGYIFAAKVGCGYVAEIGSMRISDEIDALEVMGIRSKAYILASRLLGAWIATPFLILVGLYLWSLANKWVPVNVLGFLSPGMFDHGFWDFQPPLELFFLLMKGMFVVTVIVVVACYYGFTAQGGPVQVGWNTAKSMMVNVVLIHLLDDLGQELLYGLGGKFPIAN